LLSTEGYRYVQVATGSLLGMLVPVLNYFLGVVAFDETISWRSVVGSVTVLGACVVVLLKSNNK
ncbi:EamA family transporter, partial [Planctomycetota bacterium]